MMGYAIFVLFAYAFTAIESRASDNFNDSNHSALIEKAENAIMVFQKALKGELMAAMQKGGPKAAVEICNEKAPQIAEKVNLNENVTIRRTSLKVRNPGNAPDEWERQTLENFEKRKANGENINAIKAYKNAGDTFVYMKPIPMMGMCASCHGTNISKPLYSHIKEFYPDDKAIGFDIGDIRGAFVVEINMNRDEYE